MLFLSNKKKVLTANSLPVFAQKNDRNKYIPGILCTIEEIVREGQALEVFALLGDPTLAELWKQVVYIEVQYS